MPIKLVTQKAGYKRVTYYLHRKTANLSFEILNKYAKAIGHDFSDDIPEMNQFVVEEAGSVYSKEPETLEEAIKQINEWREKYYALMEKYITYIEKNKQ